MPDFFSMVSTFFLTADFERFFVVFGQNRWLASGEMTGKCGKRAVISGSDLDALRMVQG
jgi:hypothetical protein